MKNLNVKNESKFMKGLKKIAKRKLFKNKLFSIILTILGLITIKMSDGNITAFIFIEFIAVPLFFAKENLIV